MKILKITSAVLSLALLTNCAPTSMVKETTDLNEKSSVFAGEEDIYRVVEEDGSGALQSPSSGVIPAPAVEDAVGQNPNAIYKRGCVFQLRGENGARWFTERYTAWENNDCSGELSQVIANNPKATVLGIDTNFVADQVPSEDHKTKCTFVLRGTNGAIWITERYRVADGQCLGDELSMVHANNPNARVLSVTANYVHDPVVGADKNKCRFQLIGAKGNRWFSERYLPSSISCNTEISTVRANNPQARIESITQNYVHDPY